MPKLSEVSGKKKLKLSQVQAAAAPRPSAGDRVRRDLGLSARNVVEGAGDLVGLVADPLILGWNKVTGDNQQTTREGWGSALDRFGAPRPETSSERVQADAGRALTGTALTMGVGGLAPVASRLRDLLTAAPKLQIAGTTVGSTAAGASREAGLPVGAQVGAGIIGGLAPASFGAGASVVRDSARRVVSPFTARGADAAAATIMRGAALHPESLRTPAPSTVAGSSRTFAEETLDPGIAQLQRTVAARRGAQFDQMRRTSNAARSTALSKIAGDETAMDAAELARATKANPLRAEAMKIDGVDTSRLLSQIKRLERAQEGRPAVQKGLSDIRGLLTRQVPEAERKKAAIGPLQAFIESGRKSSADFDAAKTAMTMIRRGEVPTGKLSSIAGQAALKEAKRAFSVESMGHDKVPVLDNVRKTIGDMLGGKYGGDSAQALAGSRELMAVKNQLDRVLAKQAPQYGEYIEAYKQGSKPINRMQLGQTLLDSGAGKTVDPTTGAYHILPGRFGAQAKNLDLAARAATGFKKAKAADILSPQDFNTIRAVDDDLARQVFADTAARGSGSDSFQKFMTQGDILGAMQELGVSIPGGQIIKMLGDKGAARVNARLAEALANPAEARRILQSVSPMERQIMEEALMRFQGSPGALAPVLAGQDD